MKIKAILKNKEGKGEIITIVIVMCILMLMLIIFEYFTVTSQLKEVRQHLDSSILSVVTSKYYDIYQSARQGSASSYHADETELVENLNVNDIYDELVMRCHLINNNGDYVYVVDDKIKYKISDLDLRVINGNLNKKGTVFNIETKIKVTIPLRFLDNVYTTNLTLRSKGGYSNKF